MKKIFLVVAILAVSQLVTAQNKKTGIKESFRSLRIGFSELVLIP